MLTRICQTCVRFVIGRPVCVSVRVFVCVACLCLHIFRTQKYCLGLLQLRAPDTTYYYNYHIVITFGLSHVRISRCRHRRHQHALTHTYQRTHTQMDTHTNIHSTYGVSVCQQQPAFRRVPCQGKVLLLAHFREMSADPCGLASSIKYVPLK